MRPRGIPEVPMPSIRTIVDRDGTTHRVAEFTEEHRRFLVDVREQLVQLRSRQAIPDAITNLKATGRAFSNIIQFTRSSDADFYEVLHALTPSLLDANLQTTDIGNSAMWVDNVGNSGVQKFYWVRARKFTGVVSREVGPVNATTLVSTAGSASPVPPPPSNIIIVDSVTGRKIPYTLDDRTPIL